MVLNNLEQIDRSTFDLIEFVDDLIFILNNNIEIEYLNENLILKRLGYVKDDLLNQTLLNFSHPSEVIEIENQFKKIVKKGTGSFETRIKHKKGFYNWYHVNANTFMDQENKKKIILLLRDITKYKKKEKQYQEIEERLNAAPELRFWKFLYPQKLMSAVEKSREMLESVIDNIPQLIYWRDSNLKYIGCNKNYAFINGFEDPIHIISKKDKDLIWSKYKYEKIKEAEQAVIKNDKPEYNIIEDWILPNGRKVWYNINRIPLHNLEGEVIGILTTYENITERFILEQKIKNSEKKYRELHEKLKTGYFEADLEGNLRFLNNSFCEIMGYSRTELMDKNFRLFVDEKTKNELFRIFNKIYKTGVGHRDFIHKIVKKNGLEIIVEISVYLKYNSAGEKAGFNGLLRDITDKYILEQKLKESEEKYRNFINNISDVIIELDFDANFTYISPQCYDMFGFHPEDLIGENAYTFVHPDDVVSLKKALEKIKNVGDIISLEFRTRNKDDRYVPIFVRASLVEIDDTIKFIGVARDITEKKEAEEKIKESEENYRLITENVNDLICLLNENVRYEYINEDPHLKILGYTKDDLLGKSIVSFVHPDDREEGIKNIRLKKSEASGEFRVKHKKGHYLWVEVRAKTFINKENKMKIIFISRDITERKKAEKLIKESEEELKKLNKELEQKVLERTKELQESERKLREHNIELQKLDQLKTHFLTLISHELKTPLISIWGYTDLILTKYPHLDPEIIDDLSRVKSNVKRLNNYIEQLMDVLKIDAKKMEFNLELANIKDIILNCMNELDYQIKKKKLNVDVSGENDIFLPVDSDRMAQVFTNLLSNAIKFTPENGKIEISAIKLEKEGEYLFKMKDTGVGISQDQIKHLFEKFVMFENKSESISAFETGSGLGLYITKGIIEGHGGKIWATSNGKGTGAEFYFTLPILSLEK